MTRSSNGAAQSGVASPVGGASPFRRFLQSATVVLVFIVVALVSAVLTMRFAIHGAQTAMPDLSGLPEAAATAKASGRELTLSVDGRFYSDAIVAGKVLTQYPLAGTEVRRGSHVRVTESLGPQKGAVPQLVGLQERVAALEVRRAGLALSATVSMPYAAQPANTVIAQDPSPDAKRMEGPEISILLSAPAPAQGMAFVMPDLTGQNARAAAAAITRAGLHLQPLEFRDVTIPAVSMQPGQAPQMPVLPGTVLGQTPQAGQRVTESAAITLTVAR